MEKPGPGIRNGTGLGSPEELAALGLRLVPKVLKNSPEDVRVAVSAVVNGEVETIATLLGPHELLDVAQRMVIKNELVAAATSLSETGVLPAQSIRALDQFAFGSGFDPVRPNTGMPPPG